jgi:hypothetical protein
LHIVFILNIAALWNKFSHNFSNHILAGVNSDHLHSFIEGSGVPLEGNEAQGADCLDALDNSDCLFHSTRADSANKLSPVNQRETVLGLEFSFLQSMTLENLFSRFVFF